MLTSLLTRDKWRLEAVLAIVVALPLPAQEVALPTASPAAKRVDSAKLAEAAALADRELPALLSLLVWRDGALVAERYFHGADRGTVFNVKSVSKSVLSAVTGIAVREGLLDLDRPVAQYLPEYFPPLSIRDGLMFAAEAAHQDSARRRITPRHLLTMRTGQGWEENGTITMAFLMSSDPVRLATELPMVGVPGGPFNYNTGATHLLAAVLHRVTKNDLRGFAGRELFQPLGITLRRWDVDPQGVPVGGSEMFFTARDLLKFGVLYLNRGRLEGRAIVPADWVEQSLERHAEVKTPSFVDMVPGLDGYGYLWWRRTAAGKAMVCALGFGGQYLLIVPELQLVVAGGSALDGRNPGTAPQVKGIFRVVDGSVLPAVLP